MKKLKKFIYPFAFSIGFFLFYFILGTVVNTVCTADNYGGLVSALFIIMFWILIVIPIYCVIYSKIIQNGKHKFLFAIYNALVLSFSYILPFSLEDETYIYGFILFVWVLIWTGIPLFVRVFSLKNAEKTTESEAQI